MAKTTKRKPVLTSGQKLATGKGAAAKVALFSVTLERLGKPAKWEFFDNPFEGRSSEAAAYRRGFKTRTEDWLQGRDEPVTPMFRRKPDLAAFEQGYADARAQEA